MLVQESGSHVGIETTKTELRSCWYRNSKSRIEVVLVQEELGQSGGHASTEAGRAERRSC